jgi:hypothetical protein
MTPGSSWVGLASAGQSAVDHERRAGVYFSGGLVDRQGDQDDFLHCLFGSGASASHLSYSARGDGQSSASRARRAGRGKSNSGYFMSLGNPYSQRRLPVSVCFA